MKVPYLHQPEYTGDNRCLPCTLVNVIISAMCGLVVTIITDSGTLGGVTILIGLGLVHQRGYLVPRTPQLTKQYFPDRVLRLFDKESTQMINQSQEVRIDPEQVLLDANVVSPCEGGSDFCLSPWFKSEWQTNISQLPTDDHDAIRSRLEALLNDSSSQYELEESGDALLAKDEGEIVGQWPSDAAILADIGAEEALTKSSSNWMELNTYERIRVLTSLRIFIDRCPKCDGSVSVDEEVVSSCCRSFDVLVSSCHDCGAHLFEFEWTDEMGVEETGNKSKV